MEKAILIFSAIKLALNIISEAMTAVETLIGGGGTGATKKDIVLTLVKHGVGDEIYQRFETVFSLWVNLKAMLTFGSKPASDGQTT
ncbi:hypothetical protein [Desulfatirhabdium butyrativorans]|uniref:hypothetical protein n=1 Tax=Desulfatirhabdium butyrativorans TaxID=340467 RepID=UPI00040E14B4|nr:hypothetical protein [Desulfatirhabdium butyrativorans]